MEIEIRLYGEMKQYAPGDTTQFKMSIEPGASLQGVIGRLAIPESGYVLLVNGRRVNASYCFKDNDTLVLFPEICGG